MVASGILSGVHIDGFGGALLVAVIVGALNAVIPPALAALRLPFTLVLGFLLVLVADAIILLITAEVTDGVLEVDSFGWALLAALVVAAVSVVLAVVLGTSEDTYFHTHRAADRTPAGRSSPPPRSPAIVFLEIDGLALPVLRERDARRQRTDHGPLAGRGHAPPRPSGRPTCPRRRAPARRGSCWAPTRTSRPSAGWRRRPARS